MAYLGTTDYLTSPVSLKVEAWTHYNEWGLITHNAVLKCGQRELDLVKRYATHDYDSVLELYYAKTRFYDAHNRRFTAVDPILDPSGYDLREYVKNPVQFVQYLYVVNNPIIFTDLLGLNPTNALLNIDWSKVIAKDGPANNARGKEQYVKLNSVWTQLQNYYPDAGITSNGEYEAYTISHGGKYLQIQIQSESGNAEMSTLVNNKSQSWSVQKIKIGDGYAISKRELEKYFRELWCEDYYIEEMTFKDQKSLLTSLTADLLILNREADKNTVNALRNYMITGKWNKPSGEYGFFSADIKPLTTELNSREGLQLILDGIGIFSPLASLVSIGLDVDTKQLVGEEVNGLKISGDSTISIGSYAIGELYPGTKGYINAYGVISLLKKGGKNIIEENDESIKYSGDTYIHSVIISHSNALVVSRVVQNQSSVRYADIYTQNVGGARPAPAYDSVPSNNIKISYIDSSGNKRNFVYRFSN